MALSAKAAKGRGRGNVLLRRRLAAVNAHLEKLTPLPRPQVSLASLSADQVAAQRWLGQVDRHGWSILSGSLVPRSWVQRRGTVVW